MKTLRHIFMLSAAVLALAACTQNDWTDSSGLPEGKYPLVIEAGGLESVASRATVDGNWDGVTSVALSVGGTVKEYDVTASDADGYKTAILSSDTLTFATQPDEPPTVGHPALVSLGPASAIVSYEILSEGSEKLTETGCYVRQLPTGHSTKVTAAATTGICQLHIGGLECNSTYQIQPYAASPVGEAKGGTLEITTTDAVTWDEPGGLSALMGEDLYRFTSLSFAGPMNGDDLRLLRQMMPDVLFSGREIIF